MNLITVNNYHNNVSTKFYTYSPGKCCISDTLRGNNIWEPFLHEVF